MNALIVGVVRGAMLSKKVIIKKQLKDVSKTTDSTK